MDLNVCVTCTTALTLYNLTYYFSKLAFFLSPRFSPSSLNNQVSRPTSLKSLFTSMKSSDWSLYCTQFPLFQPFRSKHTLIFPRLFPLSFVLGTSGLSSDCGLVFLPSDEALKTKHRFEKNINKSCPDVFKTSILNLNIYREGDVPISFKFVDFDCVSYMGG